MVPFFFLIKTELSQISHRILRTILLIYNVTISIMKYNALIIKDFYNSLHYIGIVSNK